MFCQRLTPFRVDEEELYTETRLLGHVRSVSKGNISGLRVGHCGEWVRIVVVVMGGG